jgi:hypothetical protein
MYNVMPMRKKSDAKVQAYNTWRLFCRPEGRRVRVMGIGTHDTAAVVLWRPKRPIL